MPHAVRFRTKIPAYRRRKNCSQAIVTLTDAQSRHRRDYRLGEFGSPESREAYHRVIAEWEANGRRLPTQGVAERSVAGAPGRCISEVILEYWRWAEAYYRPKHVQSVVGALRLLRQLFGRTPADRFGPNDLRMLRDAMIRGDDRAEPPRQPWSRRYVNSQIQRLRHLFKWAAARELVPASVHQSLCTLEPLRRGRSGARENPRVGPVSDELLDAVRPHLSRPVRALVELQLLTGARSGELLGLRPIDIEMDDRTGIWTYRPEVHKNAYRDKERLIYFGPRAQELLRLFLADRPTNAFLFSPREAELTRRRLLHEARKTPFSCGNVPGSNRRVEPRRVPSQHYTTDSYCRAVQYACDRAFPPPPSLAKRDRETGRDWKARLEKEKRWNELLAWQRAHRFHPHQLRHNAATNLRKQFGLEAAQLALGHASACVTDAVYAERDTTKVLEIMKSVG